MILNKTKIEIKPSRGYINQHSIFLFICLFLQYSTSTGQNKDLKSIPFEYLKNQIIIEVQLNNDKNFVYMLLDTGVDPSVIDLKTAEKLKLNIERDSVGIASGRGNDVASVFPTLLTNLVIQDRNFGNVDGLAFDMDGISKKLGRKVHGILGYSFLKDKIVRINYKNRTIQFLDSKQALKSYTSKNAKTYSFFTDGDDMIPLINNFKINDRQFIASLDTGSSLNIQVYEHSLNNLNLNDLDKDKLKESELHGAQGKKKTFKTILKSLQLGDDLIFENQDLTISAIKNQDQIRMGNVGNRFFQKFNLVFDYVDKKVVFELN
jgi:predicted aspartyl protease